tara:strand:+ start:502 stop:1407 length:906 start_codon:yes stop_codon:yes gene_type:complete
MNHFTSNILMISPEKFRSNEFTMDDNVFQSRKSVNTEVSKKVMKEFEKLKNTISDKGISVYSIKDDSIHDTPDSVFPNNWISFHNKHKAVIYPMFAENRRYERHSDTLKKLSKKGIDVQITHDYSIYENQNKFLEGTGSIVLDRNSKVAYCSLSMRSDQELFNKFCGDLNYRPVIFNSIYESKPIYHTNVLMSICSNFCIICLESIKNEDEKNNVIKSLENSSLEIIDITYNQMSSYLGNCIQLLDKDGNPVLVMSSSAINSISNQQLKRILNHTDIIHSDIKTIENYGGGSARCMIAEIF